ncbi:non-specific lipid transfer protein GPI-anchored 11-like [Andrographis paniculata]|uniref:non-specific lipid transfer protein GPI-anchored 11-like n=1 Tax=Andrographis paniculata TaxID=175694 RepID=UPI0021E7C34E|nr:non-specific lipid transfer protein GPI-anchored 11-like [Andrographis paniculata]
MAIPKLTAIAYLLTAAAVFLAAIPRQSAAEPAVASAPSPGIDCFPYLINMSDCLSFVEKGSNLTQPEKGCCPELGQLVNTQPVCLCQLLSRPAQTGIPLDISRALKMPSACNVSAPPVSFCADVGVPVADSAPSEAPSQGIGLPMGSPPAPTEFPADGSAAAKNRAPPTLPSYLIIFSLALLSFLLNLIHFF